MIICQNCGRDAGPHAVIYWTKEHKVFLLCSNCASLSGTCNLCTNIKCDFEENPSTIPKTIQQVKNVQGGRFISTIKNPTREDITCKAGCFCWNKIEQCCNRDFRTCGNYKI